MKLILKTVCSGPEALASKRLSELDHLTNTNLGLAYYKLGEFSDCVFYCNKALLRRKTLPGDLLEKTLYRKASSELELGQLQVCKLTCTDLLEHFPKNAAAVLLLRRLEREILEDAKTITMSYRDIFRKNESSG